MRSAPESSRSRTPMPDLRRLARETVGASYYRRHPAEIIAYAWAKVRFERQRRTVPGMLAGLGFDPDAAFNGYAHWEADLLGAVDRAATADRDQGSIPATNGRLLYGLVRCLRPAHIIETGVAAGISTSFMAAALIDNGSGTLISIDLPSSGPVQHADGSNFDFSSRGVGWAVPSKIRDGLGDRHRLVLDDARRALPRLLDELGAVDLFVHDDLHTPDHMRWQFDLVWPRLRPGGVMACDDVNHAWLAFGASVGMAPAALLNTARFGALRKPGG